MNCLRVVFLLFLLLFTAACGVTVHQKGVALAPDPGDEVVSRVLILGDAGELDVLESWPLEELLKKDAEQSDAVVYLGDNVYPKGVSEGSQDAERILEAQIKPASRARQVIFVPGNHDWAQSAPDGRGRILAQSGLIARMSGQDARVRLLPPDACPGPVYVDVADAVRIVAIDTEWLLKSHSRGGAVPLPTGCGHGPELSLQPYSSTSIGAVYDALRQAVSTAGSRRVMVVAHHPLQTRGPHGNPCLSPPLLGCFIWCQRQNLPARSYGRMRTKLEQALQGGRAPIYAAGHEHSLQVIAANGILHLVSGAASKTTPVTAGKTTLFAARALGYMRLSFLRSGRVRVEVVRCETVRCKGDTSDIFLPPEWQSAQARP